MKFSYEIISWSRPTLAAVLLGAAVSAGAPARAEDAPPYAAALDGAVAAVADKVVAWRHDIHRHPELGNRETRTAALVADRHTPGVVTSTGSLDGCQQALLRLLLRNRIEGGDRALPLSRRIRLEFLDCHLFESIYRSSRCVRS